MFQSIIFLFNFIFFLTSAALIGIGAYIQIHMNKYLDFLGNTYLNTSIILIIIGAVMLVVTFCGCCGACTDNSCLVYTYSVMLTLILLSLVGVAITVYVYKDDVKTIIKEGMTKGMQEYGEADHDGVTQTWNIMQKDFKCCGVTDFKDWKNTPFGTSGKSSAHCKMSELYSKWFLSIGDVPDMCCINASEGCGKGIGNKSEQEASATIYTNGCFTGLENFIQGNVAASAGVGVGIIVLLFFGVLTSCCVARKMRETNNYV